MTGATVLKQVQQMRLEELYERQQRRKLTMGGTAEMIGMTGRTFRRWCGHYNAEGANGLQDRRLLRASTRGARGRGVADGCPVRDSVHRLAARR